MPNPYVNKVVQSNGTTIIDISDTTAVEADVASGKYIYLASGQKVAGTKEDDVLTTKTITLNGSYSAQDDSADGYSAVTVNVQNGASMTEVQNTYGTELVITSAQSAAPSATRHTLYFEYEDESTETEYAYYDDSFIGSAITATTPTTHNNKTVTSAQLDGVEWYSYNPSAETWDTVFNGTISVADSDDAEFLIPELDSLVFTAGDEWRITVDGTEYLSTAAYSDVYAVSYIGNIAILTEGSKTGIPVFCFNFGSSFGGYSFLTAGNHAFKLEKKLTGGA